MHYSISINKKQGRKGSTLLLSFSQAPRRVCRGGFARCRFWSPRYGTHPCLFYRAPYSRRCNGSPLPRVIPRVSYNNLHTSRCVSPTPLPFFVSLLPASRFGAPSSPASPSEGDRKS